MLVFLDRHQFSRTFLFLKQPDFPRMCIKLYVAGGVFVRGLDLVVPAAGVGARSLVRVAMVEVAGKQAAPGVSDAQRAVHEDFEFDVRALLANFGNFVERQLARQDDARDAELLPETHGGEIDRVGLYG